MCCGFRNKQRNADAAHGMRSHKGSWTPEGRDDFAAATMVLLLVSHGGSRDRVLQAMSTLHELKGGCKIPLPLRETVHGTNMVRFYISTTCTSETAVPLGKYGLDKEDGYSGPN